MSRKGGGVERERTINWVFRLKKERKRNGEKVSKREGARLERRGPVYVGGKRKDTGIMGPVDECVYVYVVK